MGTSRTWASTLVLTHVFISLFLTPHRCTGHKRAPVLTRVLCVLTLLSLDTQSTGKHISACPCPYFSLFDLGERLMLCMAETIPYFVFVCFIAVVIATVRYISSMQLCILWKLTHEFTL